MAKLLCELEGIYDELKERFFKFLEGDLFDFLQGLGNARDRKFLREEMIHKGMFKSNIKLQIYDLIEAVARGTKVQVLFIENKPERNLTKIDERFKDVLKTDASLWDALSYSVRTAGGRVYLYEKKFLQLYRRLLEAKRKREKEVMITCSSAPKTKSSSMISLPLSSFDVILVDISLEENGKRCEVDGIDFANVLREVCPGIPVFIFSIISDYDVIQKAFSKGADLYVIKNQVFSVPFLYHAYIKEMGKLIGLIEEKSLRRSLLGNIRYWKYKKNYLWFGDKCYHMIDHSFSHISDDWEIANSILFPIISRGGLKEEYKLRNGRVTRDELLYSFCMAIWLHDIGHKGNDRYGEPHLIRDTHSVISGELVLSLPEAFGIEGGKNDIYEELLFPVGEEKKPVTQLILEQAKKRGALTIPEMIALFVIYHKSNCPLREKEYYKMVREGKFIPLDFFENSDKKRGVITLERILEEMSDPDFKRDFFSLVALFRFIDGLDIKISRVGDPNEEKLKKWVIKRDREYNFKRLRRLVENMALRFSNDPLQQELFVKSFSLDIEEKIREEKSLSLSELARHLTRFEEWWEEYRMLLNYCYFISAQPGHFDLHSSIERIEIRHLCGKKFEITLWTERTEKDLKDKKVFEVGKGTQTLYDRIIGKDKCYVIKELNTGKEDLKKLIDEVTIVLKSSITGDTIGEPVVWTSGET